MASRRSHRVLASCLCMIFSENRCTLFRIMHQGLMTFQARGVLTPQDLTTDGSRTMRGDINHQRRCFLGTAAATLAATQLGFGDVANAETNKSKPAGSDATKPSALFA